MDEGHRAITRAYANAEGFRRYWADETGRAGEQLIARLPLEGVRRVLDNGAGIGVNVSWLHAAAPNAFVVAADFVEAMIHEAPATAARACMDAQFLGFADETFDAVVMAFMLFHVPDPARALDEVGRVLRTEGRLAVSSWFAADDEYPPDEVWRDELDRYGAAPVPASISHHDLMDTPDKLAGLLEQAGFRSIETGDVWLEDPVSGLDEYVARRTTLGLSSTRFESLAPGDRASVVDAVRSRLAGLAAKDFTMHERAIFAWAVRAA